MVTITMEMWSIIWCFARYWYSTTIKILDENDNVLASTSINRTNDAGYYNNTYTYTDTVTHNDTGARKWDWQWQGIDSRKSYSSTWCSWT